MRLHHRFFQTLRWAGAALFTLSLELTTPALGTTLVKMDLEALSATADRILVGTVERVDSHYLAPGSQYIVTDVILRSERNLLGVPEGSRFVVRHLGGAVGEIGQRVYGEASYRIGEQVLLFAAERQGSYYSVGMAQGALHVYRDTAGVLRVEPHLDGAEFIGPTVAAASTAHTLDEVMTKVRSYLSRRLPEGTTGSNPPSNMQRRQ